VTKSISAGCCALVLSAFFVASASAQQAQAPATVASPVAILDLPYLFRNHMRFKQMDEVLKQEITTAEQQFMGEQKQLKDRAQQVVSELKPGSPEFKAAEEELAKKDADISLRVNIMRKNFAEKKAKNYFEVYQEVMGYVNYHATQSGVLLVLNFNGDPIDGTNPQSVIQGLNSTVLYKHPGVDITPVILDMCNRGVQLPPGFAPGTAGTANNVVPGVPPQRQ